MVVTDHDISPYRLSWTSHDQMWTIVMACMNALAWILNCICLNSLKKHWKGSNGDETVLQVFLSDTLLVSSSTVLYAMNAWTRGWHASDDKTDEHAWARCSAVALTSLWFCCQSIVSLMVVAIERFTLIVKHQRMTKVWLRLLIAMIWVVSISIGSAQFHPHVRVEVSGARWFCVGRWYSNDETGRGYIFGWICMVVLCLSLACTTYAYARIRIHVLKAKHEVKHMSTHRVYRSSDVRLSIRMAALVAVFVICWTPYLCTFFYHLSQYQRVPYWFDSVSTVMGYSNSFFNSILYLFMQRSANHRASSSRHVPPTGVPIAQGVNRFNKSTNGKQDNTLSAVRVPSQTTAVCDTDTFTMCLCCWCRCGMFKDGTGSMSMSRTGESSIPDKIVIGNTSTDHDLTIKPIASPRQLPRSPRNQLQTTTSPVESAPSNHNVGTKDQIVSHDSTQGSTITVPSTPVTDHATNVSNQHASQVGNRAQIVPVKPSRPSITITNIRNHGTAQTRQPSHARKPARPDHSVDDEVSKNKMHGPHVAPAHVPGTHDHRLFSRSNSYVSIMSLGSTTPYQGPVWHIRVQAPTPPQQQKSAHHSRSSSYQTTDNIAPDANENHDRPPDRRGSGVTNTLDISVASSDPNAIQTVPVIRIQAISSTDTAEYVSSMNVPLPPPISDSP